MDLKRKDIRVIIYYCWMRRLNGAEMTREINAACGEGVVNERTCQRWMKQFKGGNFDLNDQEREGRPSLDIDNV